MPRRVQMCGSDDHFPAICPKVYGGEKEQSQSDNVSPIQPNSTIQASAVTASEKLQATLPTVMGFLRCGNKRQRVRILMDGGSQTTLVRTGIFPRTENDSFQDHDLNLVGGNRIKRKLRILECQIEDLSGSFSCPLTVTEIEKPCGDVPIILPEHLQLYNHLSEVEIDIAPSPIIDVLLRVDNTHLMVWEQHILGDRSDDPVAVKCPFGWFIQGGKATSSVSLLNYLNISAVGSLEKNIGLEMAGLEPKRCKCATDQLDRGATEAMAESITQLPDDSYEIKLPWKKSPDDLPDNFQYAVKRQKCLEKQFLNKPQEWEVYCQQMREQLERGVSRHVTSDELQGDREAGRKMWFLPHFAVVKDSKTTPVRVVYDGKAQYQGCSLNDYLAKGQNINSNLFDVALRFRENEVGIIADISKMFQAIRIRPET